MLPDMSDALTEWEQPVRIKTATTTTIDFKQTTAISESDTRAVIQVADKEKLNPAIIDWSLRYILIHSKSRIVAGQYIEYQGENYKIVTTSNYTDYGYQEVVGEEVKGAIK